jgi:DNA-directed RNA polymerase subunit RPC12/RpoP
MRNCTSCLKICKIQIIFSALIFSQVGDRNNGTTWAVIILVALVVIFRLASYFLSKRGLGSQGTRKGYGYLGGTVCSNCGRPFSIHIWSLRLMVARYDRCPHCKKWSFVNRQPTEVLVTAEDKFAGSFIIEDEGSDQKNDEPEKYRRKLDDSRFDEG